MYRAHCAVVFAIAQLSCNEFRPTVYRVRFCISCLFYYVTILCITCIYCISFISCYCCSVDHLVLPAFISARQHAKRAICYHKSACPSHGLISRKRLNLGSCNFHHTVVPSLSCLRYKFYPEIPTGSPRAGASNERELGKRANIVVF